MNKRRLIKLGSVLLLVVVLGVVFAMLGTGLLGSNSTYAKAMGRLSLWLQVRLHIATPSTVLLATEAVAAWPPSEERDGAFSTMQRAVSRFSESERREFLRGIEEQILHPKGLEHGIVISMEWGAQVSLATIKRALASDNPVIRFCADFIVTERRRSKLLRAEKIDLVAFALAAGVASGNEEIQGDALSLAFHWKLTEFLKAHRKTLDALATLPESRVKRVAENCLHLLKSEQPALDLP